MKMSNSRFWRRSPRHRRSQALSSCGKPCVGTCPCPVAACLQITGNAHSTSACVCKYRACETLHTHETGFVSANIRRTYVKTEILAGMDRGREGRRGAGAGRNDENILRVLDDIYDKQLHILDGFISTLSNVSTRYSNA